MSPPLPSKKLLRNLSAKQPEPLREWDGKSRGEGVRLGQERPCTLPKRGKLLANMARDNEQVFTPGGKLNQWELATGARKTLAKAVPIPRTE